MTGGPLATIFNYAAAAETPSSVDGAMTEIIIAALSAGGLGAIVAAIVAGLFSKKKLGAEATEIITKAAAGVVTNLQAEIDRQVQLREGLAMAHAAEMAEVRRVLQLHVAWDAIAIAKMAEVGIALPPAPPVLPPRFESIDHAHGN